MNAKPAKPKKAAGLDASDVGMVDADDAGDAVGEILTLMADHRAWQRFAAQ